MKGWGLSQLKGTEVSALIEAANWVDAKKFLSKGYPDQIAIRFDHDKYDNAIRIVEVKRGDEVLASFED